MNEKNSQSPDFSKGDGLLPAIAQDAAHRRSPDDGLHERRELRRDPGHRPGGLLQPQPQQAVAQGRRERQRAGGPGRSILDCDRDTILLKVDQIGGAACHEGYKSCFFRQVTPEGLKVVGQRVFDPDEVYGKK